MQGGSIPFLCVLVVHMIAAVFWTGGSLLIARGGPPAVKGLAVAQAGAATVTIILGAVLWHAAHGDRVGRPEQILSVAAVVSIIAAVIQQACQPTFVLTEPSVRPEGLPSGC